MTPSRPIAGGTAFRTSAGAGGVPRPTGPAAPNPFSDPPERGF